MFLDYIANHPNIRSECGINWTHIDGLTPTDAVALKALARYEERQLDLYKESTGTYRGRYHN